MKRNRDGVAMWKLYCAILAFLVVCLGETAIIEVAAHQHPQKVITIYHHVGYTSWRLHQEGIALNNCFTIFQDDDGASSGTYAYCLKHVRQEFAK